MRIFVEKNINKEENYNEKKKEIGINNKELRDFVFISENDYNYFLFLIKRIFYNITKNYLIIEMINFDDLLKKNV